jgi:hypothetical protein
MEKLVLLLIFAIGGAISNWQQKKKREADAARKGNASSGNPEAATPSAREAQTAPPPVAPRPVRPVSWEDEFRRLFDQDAPGTPRQAPRPVAPPPVRPAVVSAARPVGVPPPVRPAFVTVSSPSPTPLPVPTVTSLSSRDLAPLAESRSAYARASQLDTAMATHIRRVPGAHVQLTVVQRPDDSPEVTRAVGLFKNARAARQAVMASFILNPPKSLEESPFGF